MATQLFKGIEQKFVEAEEVVKHLLEGWFCSHEEAKAASTPAGESTQPDAVPVTATPANE